MEPAPLCPPELDAIMRRCWAAAPEARPDFTTLAQELAAVAEEAAVAAVEEGEVVEGEQVDEGYTEFSSVQENHLPYACIDFKQTTKTKTTMTTTTQKEDDEQEEGEVVVVMVEEVGGDDEEEGRKRGKRGSSTTSCGTSGYGSGDQALFENLQEMFEG